MGRKREPTPEYDPSKTPLDILAEIREGEKEIQTILDDLEKLLKEPPPTSEETEAIEQQAIQPDLGPLFTETE